MSSTRKEEIRKIKAGDVIALKGILDSSGLFPSEHLDEMIAGYLRNPVTEEIWFAYTINDIPAGFGYCVPEKLTNGTFNLLAIAVIKELQGKGIGQKMLRYIELLLAKLNHRILIVETSSNDAYELTRKFYLKNGYTQMACIKDFWNDGEDKIVFWKRVN